MHRTIRAVRGTARLVMPMFLCAIGVGFAQSKTERERKPTEQVSPAPNAATQNIAAPPKKEDPVFKGLKYRVIGPFRGGRSLTASGIPGDPNIYYFGSTGGGVWKSTDGATTWAPAFKKQGTSSIGSVAVSGSYPKTYSVGTGGACIRGNISQGDGGQK